ncbi:Ima1 N-terminal domain-containing protein [Hygrophoropsis aurantiaca]|uniref:Ima1 N-terminal domain-containing protein n=1 Tax=Hygrophoropsis aurantiaca TaxID=72124 RepID=A0ACB8AHJ4_9AGAM|nr:Ima1 N-terminal domain-containing protein [Hygrophoropsis aurantiaca]
MPPFFRRSSNVSCFFCQSSITPSPANPRSFRCPHCSCLNRFDANGEILSDEPAMHDEAMNAKSFAKRASPSKDRLPSSYGRGQFCHTCQTNQMLLINLLSNYLPPPHHPDYAKRLEMLPQYRDSLHTRYPPVCAECLPAVEEEIKQKDHMARTQALGGWLQESKGKERRRQVSGTGRERDGLEAHITAWRIRGFLWVTTLAMTLTAHSIVIWDWAPPTFMNSVIPALPAFALVSIFWTAWDPTYYSFRRARIQGRDVRVQGKNLYITLQIFAWLSRLLTTALFALPRYSPLHDYLLVSQSTSIRSRIYCSISLVLELSVVTTSFFVLRVKQPPPVRLIDTSSNRFPSRATSEVVSRHGSVRPSPGPALMSTSEPDFLAALSLSSKPVVQSSNPVFGLPSLLSNIPPPASPIKIDDDEDENAMDWTPTNPSPSKNDTTKKHIGAHNDGSWLRPQRFYPPEKPTGLEALFANTKLVDDGDQKDRSASRNTNEADKHPYWWWWIAAASLILVPLGGVAVRTWKNRNAEVMYGGTE